MALFLVAILSGLALGAALAVLLDPLVVIGLGGAITVVCGLVWLERGRL